MGELAARELADDLVDEWHDLADDEVSLHSYMGLTAEEYGRWLSSHELPRDFERRHAAR